jgi:hypothetical protein
MKKNIIFIAALLLSFAGFSQNVGKKKLIGYWELQNSENVDENLSINFSDSIVVFRGRADTYSDFRIPSMVKI